eukprot:gb/GEZN01003909.1/.p1 GENE.gb/GEZN01003909.1/~~gb/GEZN01003909.1/.p1  ORF type:complete len:523 (-),score=126.23 gb/GEZN01003909.1/:355-1923(-)
MEILDDLTLQALQERKVGFFTALHKLACLGTGKKHDELLQNAVHHGLIEVLLENVLPECLEASEPLQVLAERSSDSKQNNHTQAVKMTLSSLAIALLVLSRIGSAGQSLQAVSAVSKNKQHQEAQASMVDWLLKTSPKLVKTVAIALARAGDQGDGPAQLAALQLLLDWSKAGPVLLELGQERFGLLLVHLLATHRLPTFSQTTADDAAATNRTDQAQLATAVSSDTADTHATATDSNDTTGKQAGRNSGKTAAKAAEGKTTKQDMPSGSRQQQQRGTSSRQQQDLDTRLCVFALALLANLSVLSLWNHEIADNSGVRVATQIFQQDTHPDMLLQTSKLLLNLARTSSTLKAQVVQSIGSFGFVLALVMHPNPTLRDASKSLLSIFPVGEQAKSGHKVLPSEMSLADQQAFQQRVLQLRSSGASLQPPDKGKSQEFPDNGNTAPTLSSKRSKHKHKAAKVNAQSKSVRVSALQQCSSTGCGKQETSSGQYMICGRCKSATYCSAACQKWHWNHGHKAECHKV